MKGLLPMTKTTDRQTAYWLEALARCLLPEIQKFFESEEGKQAFEHWKAKQMVERTD
jgi:hypothetical protein